MCGRYSLAKVKNLKERYDAYNDPKIFSSLDIRPGSVNPTVIANGVPSIEMMKWGLIPFWESKGSLKQIINARSEGIDNKPMFKNMIAQHRCLIPATSFFEWQRLVTEGKEEKIPWSIKVKNEDIFSMAGIYQSKGNRYNYCIITTSPNTIVSKIHSRMPVIIDRKDEEKYINPKTDIAEILNLLVPFDHTPMSIQIAK